MAVVLDANLLVALVSGDPRADAVSTLLADWLHSSEQLHAPALTPYEVANALTRLVAAKEMPEDRVAPAWTALQALPIAHHPLVDGPGVVRMARRLDRQSAHDAAYLTLAVELDATCWTLDGHLARSASRLGLAVRLVS